MAYSEIVFLEELKKRYVASIKDCETTISRSKVMVSRLITDNFAMGPLPSKKKKAVDNAIIASEVSITHNENVQKHIQERIAGVMQKIHALG
jgi:hypothetical protein